MILQPLEYSVASLLHSDDTVGFCQLEGDRLKDLILTVREAGWALVVVETVSGAHWLIFAARPAHQGNLVGDIRKWTRQFGCEFFVKRSDERNPTPQDNMFTLPDGRTIEIKNVFARSSNFTHWGLGQRKVLPSGYVRL